MLTRSLASAVLLSTVLMLSACGSPDQSCTPVALADLGNSPAPATVCKPASIKAPVYIPELSYAPN